MAILTRIQTTILKMNELLSQVCRGSLLAVLKIEHLVPRFCRTYVKIYSIGLGCPYSKYFVHAINQAKISYFWCLDCNSFSTM